MRPVVLWPHFSLSARVNSCARGREYRPGVGRFEVRLPGTAPQERFNWVNTTAAHQAIKPPTLQGPNAHNSASVRLLLGAAPLGHWTLWSGAKPDD
jgi:hypothetical protein